MKETKHAQEQETQQQKPQQNNTALAGLFSLESHGEGQIPSS